MNSARPHLFVALVAAVLPTAASHADIDPLSGIDFVHITEPGNAPWTGSGLPVTDHAIGRGSVGDAESVGLIGCGGGDDGVDRVRHHRDRRDHVADPGR